MRLFGIQTLTHFHLYGLIPAPLLTEGSNQEGAKNIQRFSLLTKEPTVLKADVSVPRLLTVV